MMLFYTHPWIDICMKRKEIPIKSICFFRVQNFWPIDLESFAVGFYGEITWPVTYAGTSFMAENGNAYLKRVSIVLEVTFTEMSVRGAIQVLFFICYNCKTMKCCLSKWICAYNFIPVRIFKNIDNWKSKIFNKKTPNFHFLLRVPFILCVPLPVSVFLCVYLSFCLSVCLSLSFSLPPPPPVSLFVSLSACRCDCL